MRLLVTGSAIRGLPVVTIAGALVVPDATKEFVEDDLVGLGAAVDEFRSRLGIR